MHDGPMKVSPLPSGETDPLPDDLGGVVKLLHEAISHTLDSSDGQLEPAVIILTKVSVEGNPIKSVDDLRKAIVDKALAKMLPAPETITGYACVMIPVGDWFSSNEDKDRVADAINKFLDDGTADAIILITEAWQTLYPPGERTEIVMFNTMTATHQWWCRAEINRELKRLEPLRVDSSRVGTFEGRFARRGAPIH